MHHDESRFDKRLRVDFPVSVVDVDGEGVSRARNLSPGGVQLSPSGEAFALGQRLELGLRLPGAGDAIWCAGTVVYLRADAVGVEFTRVPSRGLELLEEFIASRRASGP